jgi:GT2 family glycosyltransferase
LIILLDADIIADKGLVAAHDDLHQKFKYPVLGCGRLLPYKPCYKSYIDQVANPDAGLDRGDTPEDFPFYHAFGGHLSYTKQTFNRVGPFDPELRGAEDTEFAYRASKLDVRIKNCCQAIGYHNHSRSLDERRKRGYAYSMMIPQLIELHPELRGKIPGMAELEPLDWTNDPLSLKRAKMRAIFWSLKFNRTLLASFLEFCERYRAMPRFAKAGYYRLILGDMRAGAVNHLGHNGDCAR